MDELNSRPFPPVPNSTDVPRRDLNNGWLEYETEAGRTYFYNFETGKSQWIPPRFIRTPAQVQALLQATRNDVDEKCSATSAKCENSHHSVEDGFSQNISSSTRVATCDEALTGAAVFSERKYSYEQIKSRRRDWMVNFMYLTSAHLILYKDEKSAECYVLAIFFQKHGNHYAAPKGVCDLKGASVSWLVMEKEKRKRKVIQVYNRRHAQTPSRADSMAHSSIEYTGSSIVTPAVTNFVAEEPRPSRESILEKLIRFFRNRPSVESLKEKGIYKLFSFSSSLYIFRFRGSVLLFSDEPVFGSTLSAICQLENSLVPKFIRTVTELIESRGLEIDGLYRVSGNLSAVQKIRCQVDQDKYAALVSEEDVHVLTGALKLFFRELAEPVFPPSLTKDYLNAIKIQNPKQRFKRFDELLRMLPPENRETLKMLLRHLLRVASHSDKNRMQIHNLAIMFGPTLFSNGEEKRPMKKKDGSKKKKDQKKEEIPTVQSNSHLAFNMIMQGQIVEYLLIEHNKFEALQGPVQTHPH
ncbi:unnamed protein product [Angiostrongylus costaricensis]|uniref:Rho GTPase activating protein 27 n=1 Tax=Angiostrongylus costaricensis TaxID=334426 RepID=A0A158PIF6_ANGCS|nr:unnamed protein product [Angiostrongylus costaricensis]